MRKKILLMLSVFCFMGASLMAQTNNIEGGAGVIAVDGNPNLNANLVDVSVNEGHIAYDRDNQIAYFFDPSGTAYDAIGSPLTPGTQWIAVDISDVTNPITSVVVDAGGTPELTATTVGGVTTLSFESDATIAYNSTTNILTFTDVDGDDSTVDLSDLATLADVQAANTSVTVSGTGTGADPYLVSITGSGTATTGQVPQSDGAGGLTWDTVIDGITVNNDGTIDVTTSDGTVTPLDLSNIPTVANITELNAAAAALGAGEEGIVRADENNTFGMPATSAVGVLFFISN